MSAALILPILPAGRVPPATVGPAFPTAAALGKDVRATLPPALVEALDRIGDQIEAEIVAPLLSAASEEQLARTFEQVFASFRDYYISTILIMWGCLQEDPKRFAVLTVRSFQDAQNLVRERGPQWIGEDASLNALEGLATIMRIAKAATKLFTSGSSADLQPNKSDPEQWTNSIIAYAMAFSCVLSSLTALTGGRINSVRSENVVALAHWSRSYAVQAYHFTKAMGLLRTASSTAPLTENDDEDLVLAEAGFDSYAQSLNHDDEG
jgi:hypothetical protein